MRDNFGADWAFGIRGAIENVVRASFPGEVRLWPLLQTFDFESYTVGNYHFVVILRDKLSGIPSGFDPKPFPHTDFPPLPVTPQSVGLWQSYLISTFALRAEDAAIVLPIHDSGKNNASEDYKLFASEEKALWDLQLQLTVARQKTIIQATPATPPQAPTHITYNVSGTSARININSADSSVNIVQEQSPEVFEELLSAVRRSAADAAKLEVLERTVVEMQESFGTPTFGEKYKAFMSVLADHIQVFGPIIAPYLPALASLVT